MKPSSEATEGVNGAACGRGPWTLHEHVEHPHHERIRVDMRLRLRIDAIDMSNNQ
ncbi:MAG: hypothetical protein JWN03_9084 [Nocardia sp.]|nr:hypothetical protein [Nocardia sp.]